MISVVENVRGVTSRFAHLEKSGLNFSSSSFSCNPCQSSPSLTILVPLWFIIISLVFFYISKALFSGLLHFRGNFVHCPQTNSKYCD